MPKGSVITTSDFKWIYEAPPDKQAKVNLLTRAGVATLGIWGTGHNVIAYHPLPKRDKQLEEELLGKPWWIRE